MDKELEAYYMDQYRRMLGTEIPQAVYEKHEQAKFMLDRMGGGQLTPAMMMAVVFASGCKIKTPNDKGDENPKTPTPKVR